MKHSEYLKDETGKPSSTRLFSMWTLKFFFGFSVFTTLVLLLIIALLGPGDGTLILVVAGYFVTLDILLLIAAFAPKQMSKLSEIRKLVELAKNGTK